MKKRVHAQKGKFSKVAECLYRYSTSDKYYARFKKHGKIIIKSLETTDLALAKRKLRDIRHENEILDRKAENEPFSVYLDRYLETIGVFDRSTQVQKRGIANLLRRTWSEGVKKRIAHIKPSEPQTWLAKQKERGISDSSYNHYLSFLRDVFNLAVNDRALFSNPLTSLKYIKNKKALAEIPTLEQYEQILNSIKTQTNNADAEDSADFVQFIALAGLGNSEVAAIKWKDVDFKNNKIRVYRNKTDSGFMIPIYPQLMLLLKSLKEKRQNNLNPEDTVLKIKNARKAITNACKRLNLPRYGHRSFRRMFIRRCVEKNIDFQTISAWQGHRDGGVLVAKTYSHLRQEHSDEMAKKLD